MVDKDCKNGNGKVKMALNENDIKHIRGELKDIKDNHLPHIYKRLSSLELKVASYAGGIAVIVILTNVILKLI